MSHFCQHQVSFYKDITLQHLGRQVIEQLCLEPAGKSFAAIMMPTVVGDQQFRIDLITNFFVQ